MAVNKNLRLGSAGSNVNDLGSMGALSPILGQLAGGEKGGNMAMDFARQMYPDAPKADPYEAALQFFLAMGQGASQPGATVLGSAVGAMQAPADYLAAKKKEKTETDRARMKTALQLAPSLKPAAGKVTYRPATAAELTQYGATSGQMGSDGKFYDLSKTSGSQNNDLKPFGLIDNTKLAEIQIVIPTASLDVNGNILLTDAESRMAGVRPYIGQKIVPDKSSEAVREPKFSDDGTGTLRYTANPPEGKNIGDIVFEGVDITGFTQNDRQLANSLRDDLTKQIEPFRDIRSAFSQIDGFYEEAQSENSPVSDYSLAVQYAKVIDPGTAAREGEVAAIATAGAMSSAFKAALTNALMGTGKLSPRMRASIYNNALRIYGTKLPGALATIERYKTVSNAQKDGLFKLVGLNVDVESYKPVGEGGYQPKDIDSLGETPEDNSTYKFPPDFNFDALDDNALRGLLRLPTGALDDMTLRKIDEALSN
tara:strand:- start:41 stop:1486 length:1446 start_codon:yes stop_codon:yes gene_type:complete